MTTYNLYYHTEIDYKIYILTFNSEAIFELFMEERNGNS